MFLCYTLWVWKNYVTWVGNWRAFVCAFLSFDFWKKLPRKFGKLKITIKNVKIQERENQWSIAIFSCLICGHFYGFFFCYISSITTQFKFYEILIFRNFLVQFLFFPKVSLQRSTFWNIFKKSLKSSNINSSLRNFFLNSQILDFFRENFWMILTFSTYFQILPKNWKSSGELKIS
jgi:hypothetical protein